MVDQLHTLPSVYMWIYGDLVNHFEVILADVFLLFLLEWFKKYQFFIIVYLLFEWFIFSKSLDVNPLHVLWMWGLCHVVISR